MHAGSDPTAAFQSATWKVISDPSMVDGLVMEALRSEFGEDKRLAAPKEPFEATDIVSGRPSRRFLLAGQAQASWFIAYEHGGFGHHIHLVVFDASGTSPTIQLSLSGSAGKHNDIVGWRVSLKDLNAAVTDGRLSTSDDF